MGKRKEPNLGEVFAHIKRKKHKSTNVSTQIEVLRELFAPEHIAGLDKTQVHEKVRRFRKKIVGQVRSFGRGKIGGCKCDPPHKLADDLFRKGPEPLFTAAYLREKGYFSYCESQKQEHHDEDAEQDPETESAQDVPANQPGEHFQTRKMEEAVPEIPESEQTPESELPRLASAETSSNIALADSTKITGYSVRSASPQGMTVAQHTREPRQQGRKRSADRQEASAIEPKSKRTKNAQTATEQEEEQEERTARPLDQVPTWVQMSGRRSNEIILRTKKPKLPNIPTRDANWIGKHMNALGKALFETMFALVQEHCLDQKAATEFVQVPEDSLDQLYVTMFRASPWQPVAAKADDPSVFRQDWTLFGLLGTGIFELVFKKDLPWDMKDVLSDSSSREAPYIREIFTDLGHQIETIRRYVIGKQIMDQDFYDREVVPYAHRLAAGLLLTLAPHVRKMRKSRAKGSTLELASSQDLLADVMAKAIVVKQTLASSKLGPFRYQWPKPWQKIVPEKHNQKFEIGAEAQVLHAVLPIILRQREDGPLYYYKALVIPTAATEGQMD